ncbi:MAG: heat-inducible transcriptional repressor HrcA [Ferrimicrobium sp.]
MTVGDLGTRKEAILRAVVSEHVRTAEPIGSQHLLRVADIAASAATVRSQMAQLERDGFLLQPHISAGRVPSVKGYRYFVDRLMEIDDAARDEVAWSVEQFVLSARGALEGVLDRSLVFLADQTNYTAVVTMWSSKIEMIKLVQLVSLSGTLVLAVVVGSRGTVERWTFHSDQPVDDGIVGEASNVLTHHLRGLRFTGELAVPSVSNPVIDALVSVVLDGIHQRLASPDAALKIKEVSKTASALEQLETVARVLETLEQQLQMVSLIRNLLEAGETVSIGDESGLDALRECSLIIAPCEVDGELVGSIGVLGPTRMNYSRATAVVAAMQNAVAQAVQ